MSTSINYESFLKVYSKYKDTFDIEYCPSELWFKLVENSHKQLRKLIGGIDTTFDINVKDAFKPENDEHLADTITDILFEIPDYLQKYKIQETDLHKPYLPNGIKTTKHLMEYSRRIKLNNYSFEANVNELGSILSDGKNQKDEMIHCLMSTSPFAFLSLGNFDCDSDSCFSSQREYIEDEGHSLDKYRLAICKNSFVMLFFDSPAEYSKIPFWDLDPAARCWGFMNDNKITFTNFYIDGGNMGESSWCNDIINRNAVELCCSDISKKLLKIKNINRFTKNIKTDDVYLNNDSVTYYTGNPKKYNHLEREHQNGSLLTKTLKI